MMELTNKENLIGQSSSFLAVLEQVSNLAGLSKPVLIVGERGTGKEAIAARLHYLSPRWDKPYLKLNCAAINENLLETELFGHEAGAFTGAAKKHLGRFELANGGSLFLDELGNSSAAIQEKLLRVIEYGEMERVGSSRTIAVDVRLIAATNANLPQMAANGEFRADLLDRLAFDVVTLPPLRARIDDILLLADHFALNMVRELGREYFPGFSPNARQALLDYSWPGNVRELKNVVERNVYRAAEDEVIDNIVFDPFASPYPELGDPKGSEKAATSKIMPNRKDEFSFPIDFKETVIKLEVDLIQSAMEEAKFNQRRCAELLGLTYHQLRGYLKKYKLLK